jgi:hypothetical protein
MHRLPPSPLIHTFPYSFTAAIFKTDKTNPTERVTFVAAVLTPRKHLFIVCRIISMVTLNIPRNYKLSLALPRTLGRLHNPVSLSSPLPLAQRTAAEYVRKSILPVKGGFKNWYYLLSHFCDEQSIEVVKFRAAYIPWTSHWASIKKCSSI